MFASQIFEITWEMTKLFVDIMVNVLYSRRDLLPSRPAEYAD